MAHLRRLAPVPDAAECGDHAAGKRIITPAVRQAMSRLLAAVRDGSFVRQWIDECEQGCPTFKARPLPIEEAGAQLRQRMPFLDHFTLEEQQETPQLVPLPCLFPRLCASA